MSLEDELAYERQISRPLSCGHAHVTPREGCYAGRCTGCDACTNVDPELGQHWAGPTWTELRTFLRALAAPGVVERLPAELAREAAHLASKLERIDVLTMHEEAFVEGQARAPRAAP